MIFGLNSSGWAGGWSLDELIEHAQAAGILGIELQLGTAHGVGPELEAPKREQAKQKITDAGVHLIGLASDIRVDHADEDARGEAVAAIREAMRLSHDIGGIGVTMHARELPGRDGHRGRAIDRIGRTLRQIATFAEGWGQQVRIELSGDCAPPAIANRILDAADHHNVTFAWSSRPDDLSDDGLAHDFNALADRLGETAYVGPLDDDDYPYFELVQRLREADYLYWVILRTRGEPPANVRDALDAQHRLFTRLADA